jgi:predicted RNase H-like HicB family nuclease
MKQLKLRYESRIWRDEAWYIAQAWPLDVVTQGRSEAEAEANLKDAVSGFLKAVEDHGTLDEVLEECGYRQEGDTWVFPPVSSRETLLAVG